MSFEPSGYTSFQHEYVDYENNLQKFIVYPTDTRNSPVVFSQHYNTGVNQRVFLEWDKIFFQYDITPSGDHINCQIERLRDDTSDLSDDVYQLFTHHSPEHVIRSASTWGWFRDPTFQQYMGIEYVRGIPCHRWTTPPVSFTLYPSDHPWMTASQLQITSNVTVSAYFMVKDYNVLYPNYDIPVRIRFLGHGKFYNNVATNDIIYDRDVEHIYDFINFIPKKPSSLHFIPPSLATCNITNWCSDIQDIKYFEETKYIHLIDLCDKDNLASNGNDFMVNTDCYMDNCGFEYTTPSCGSASDCNINETSAVFWVVIILMLFVGMTIGCILSLCKREKKIVSFKRYDENEQFE